MNKSKIAIVITMVLVLAVSLVVPALAEAGGSWYEYGEGTLDTYVNDDGSITIKGGDGLYPFHYMVYRDKLKLDGFSTKLSASLWNRQDVSTFAYIAFGTEIKEGVNIELGVGTNVEIKDGVIFRFQAVNTAEDYGFTGPGIGVVFQVYQNNEPIPYYNDYGNVFIPASKFENLTFSVAKKDIGYEFKINDVVFDYAPPRQAAVGQSVNFAALDNIFKDGEAYFSAGMVVLENLPASFTVHEINGTKTADLVAENAVISTPDVSDTQSGTSSISFDDEESAGGCGNKAE